MNESIEATPVALDPFAWHKSVYRAAIDPRAGDGEGLTWWTAVAAELDAVVAAPSPHAAARAIAWWHNDWEEVGDSALKAAQRMRLAARQVHRQCRT